VSTRLPASIPDIVDVTLVLGANATADTAQLRLRLLIDVPHGATTTHDFESLASQLESPLPRDLIDFFYVNTDTGAPELALAIANAIVADAPDTAVAITRSRIPRTFIDCNRVIDASPEAFKEGGVAPGLMPWITTAADRALLRARYDAYQSVVQAAMAMLAPDGAMLLMHTYAPRTVGVEVDLNIVDSLHAAYAPDVETTWPLRPELDVIGRALDGTLMAPADVMAALTRELASIDHKLGDSSTYALHPSTLGWHHAVALPGRCLCLEARRDLFVERFIPFAEASIDPHRTAALASPIARALSTWWP
jgi:hypothetical protein